MRSNLAAVPRAPSPNTDQHTVRMPKEWTARAEALRPKLAVSGLDVGLSDVLRVAIQRGLDALELEVRDKEGKRRK